MTKATTKKATVKPTMANRKNSETTTTFTTTGTKVKTPNFNGNNFHRITVNTPCQIFVDKTTTAMYITTNCTTLTGKRPVSTR